MDGSILVGKGEAEVRLLLRYANRHGLVAGATGTGKTVTLQTLAEGFSAAGVPVFMADVKGDLSGIAEPAQPTPRLLERAAAMGLSIEPRGCPTVFWDLFGEKGHPVRTTVSEMGPLLLARLLELNDTQEGVLNIAFRVADEDGLLLLDLKDLRAVLAHVAERAAELSASYGNVSRASVGAIQRQLLVLEGQGGDRFFGEPALELADLMRTAQDGRGYVNLLAADRLVRSPRLYATFLLWLLAELFEELPELGDVEKPRLVFFFDEAHLLFDGAPKALVDKVEQVVRLIRSKGVGVYFVTQNPLDVPETVAGQLGNRVQHALRAFTPRDQKAVRTAAETFRPKPGLDTAAAITELGVGEALASVLDERGSPTPVERALVRPPASRLGPAGPERIAQALRESGLGPRYDRTVDRESAHERLTRRAETPPPFKAPPARAQAAHAQAARPQARPAQPRARQPEAAADVLAKSLARGVGNAIGGRVGRELVRGVLGALLRGR